MSTPRTWQHTLSGEDPVVAQHHVQGANLLPGAAMIGLVLEAARALGGAIPVGLATARISATLAVAAGETVTGAG